MPIVQNGETYLTAAEVSQRLGISRDTFYRTVRNRLQPYTLGVLRRTYYRQSDVDALQGARPAHPDEDKP